MIKETVVRGSSYDSFRVASINILNNKDSFLEVRLPNLISELRTVDADVVLFQEVILDFREALQERMEELGYRFSHFARCCIDRNKPDRVNGTAVFSRIEGTEFNELKFSDPFNNGFEERLMAAAVAVFQIKGRSYHVLSNHLAWGGGNERYRLSQARELMEYASSVRVAEPGAVVIAGGDFNTHSDSATLRYLKGLDVVPEFDDSNRDLWVDAWEAVGADDRIATTSRGNDFWGSSTARGVGISFPELIPGRRIDYLLSFGWCYGRSGCPLRFGRFADRLTGDANEVSDHCGIFADFLTL